MDNTNRSFTELEVWKKARDLKNEIFNEVKSFPVDEKFRLADQMVRASRSINANISEGYGRFSFKDQVHFCVQSRGSLSELYNHLIDAYDCNYIDKEKFIHFKTKVKEIERLLNGYISHLRKNIT